MFADACEKVSHFTHPVIMSLRFFDRTIQCSLASYIVINSEGWIATVAHIITPFQLFQQHSKEIEAYHRQVAAIEQDEQQSSKQKQKIISRIKTNPKWITNISFFWGTLRGRIEQFKIFPEADLAIGQMKPFNQKLISTYPIFKEPSKLLIGTSLCKLGFPLHQINATFDENISEFKLESGALPAPRFPIEGIATRHITAGKSKDGKHEVKFLETSSPGLKGQSGGPIFDTQGTVWSIQSRTSTIPLGFSAKVKKNGREVEENQLLSLGLGVHPETLITFLNENAIKFQLSSY